MRMRPEHKKKAVKVLGAVAPFSALSAHTLNQLVQGDNVQLKEFSAGQQVFPCRSVKDSLCVLLSGGCKCLLGNRIVSVGGEGTLFGEELLYADAESDIKAVASEVCRALFVSCDAVDMLVEDSSDFARSYIALLSRKLAAAKSGAGSGDKAQAVLAGYLLSRPHNAKGEVSLPQDMLKTAKQLNLSKSALFSAIDALNSSGAITFNGNAVCIKDEDKLKGFV